MTPLRPKWGQENIVKTALNGTSLLHTPGVHQSKFSIFFYLKNLIGSFDFPKILLSPLARFAPGLQSPLVHFCAHGCLLLCCNLCICNVCFLCVLFFSLCCYVFFSACIHEISGAFFGLFHFCMLLTVWICVVHNQLCTHLLAGLIFVFVCVFAGLSNFL